MGVYKRRMEHNGSVFLKIYGAGLQDSFPTYGAILRESATSAWDSVKSAWESTVQFFTDLWNNIVETAVRKWDMVVDAWNQAVDKIYSIFGPIIDFYVEIWSDVKDIRNTLTWLNRLVLGALILQILSFAIEKI